MKLTKKGDKMVMKCKQFKVQACTLLVLFLACFMAIGQEAEVVEPVEDGNSRLAGSVSLDFFDVESSYEAESNNGTVSQDGDLDGSLYGATILLDRPPVNGWDLKYGLGIRYGTLDGTLTTTGNTIPYTVDGELTRLELEAAAIFSPQQSSNYASYFYTAGLLYINSEMEQDAPGDDYSNNSYIVTLGIGGDLTTQLGSVTLGGQARVNALLGLAAPEFGGSEFIYGYDAEVGLLLEFPLASEPRKGTFFAQLGLKLRDYDGEDEEFPDAAELEGIYGRIGYRCSY